MSRELSTRIRPSVARLPVQESPASLLSQPHPSSNLAFFIRDARRPSAQTLYFTLNSSGGLVYYFLLVCHQLEHPDPSSVRGPLTLEPHSRQESESRGARSQPKHAKSPYLVVVATTSTGSLQYRPRSQPSDKSNTCWGLSVVTYYFSFLVS